ncbi:MAG: FtsL-like putative cell division protein [Lutibacter sp.]
MGKIKNNIYQFLQGKFLVSKESLKNWNFIVYVVFLLLVMIGSAHYADKEVMEMARLKKEIKELKAEFVDTRSLAMKLKLESNIKKNVSTMGLHPSEKPPVVIKVVRK